MDDHHTAVGLCIEVVLTEDHMVVWVLTLLSTQLNIHLLSPINTLPLNDAECHKIISYQLKHSRSIRTVTSITLTSLASYGLVVLKTQTMTKAYMGDAKPLLAI